MSTIAIIIALVVAGLVLFFLEICTPSFGILTAMALMSFIGAVWLTFGISGLAGMILLAGLLVVIPAYLVILVKLLPKSPIGKRMFLGNARQAGGEATPLADQYNSLIGKIAITETPLRPAGAIRIDGKRVDALAETGLIQAGLTVRIVKSTGMGVIVHQENKIT